MFSIKIGLQWLLEFNQMESFSITSNQILLVLYLNHNYYN